MIGCSRILAILLPALRAATPGAASTAAASVHCRCMPNATAVADRIESELAPLHDRGLPRLVGPQRRRERGERAAARRARDRALRLPRRQRAVRRDRDRARGQPTARRVAGSTCSTTSSSPSRRRPSSARGSSSSRHRSRCASRSIAARSTGRRVDDNEIRQILRDSDDVAERRAAWEASKTVGAAVAEDVRELARLRNAAAHSLGYRDWFALSVATSEMDEDKLMATLDERRPRHRRAVRALEGGARRAARGPLRLRRRPSSRPWHYADAFFQEVPAEGGVDLDAFLEDADLVEITPPHVRRHRARDAHRDRPQRPVPARRQVPARVLHRRRPRRRHPRARERRADASSGWTRCCTSSATRPSTPASTPSLPWLLRDTHLVVTEGIAILMGRLASDAEWLERVVGVDPVAVAAIADALRAARAAEMLVFTRWVLVMTNFERSLYADPESDLDARWWELVERYQLVTRPDGPQQPRLGREDPRRLRARLLPHLSLRPHRRLAARGDARARVRRPRRPPRARDGCSPSGCSRPGCRCAGTS